MSKNPNAFDYDSSASRQHYIDTGKHLTYAEVAEFAPYDTAPFVADGKTDTSILVRYPNGQEIPVGVPADSTAREYAEVFGALEGYTVLSLRRQLGRTHVEQIL